MRIHQIKIQGFRNLESKILSLDSNINTHVFVGLNGHGKTNWLESIFMTGISKSFRSKKMGESVGFDQNFCSTKLWIERGDESFDLEVIITKTPLKKGLKINGVLKKAVDYIGRLNVVFFSPDDMTMIHNAPSSRRRYLDLMLSQFDRDYLDFSLKYQQILKRRNALLKGISDGLSAVDELDYWDQELSRLGLVLMSKRDDLIKDLNERAKSIYHQVSSHKDKLKIKYLPSMKKVEDEVGYFESLRLERDRDIVMGYTQLGPHRDDLLFLCNGKNMALYASRGEWRSLILTLKFSEIKLLKERTGEWPILLLDDVFSELDDQRQRYLFNEFNEVQTFITTTHEEFLKVIDGKMKIYRVNEGVIE